MKVVLWILGILIIAFVVYYFVVILPYQRKRDNCIKSGGSWLGKDCKMPNVPI